MKYSALIVAAGSGSRMGLGYNKLLYKLADGKTIIEQTVSIFAKDDRCAQIVVVCSREDRALFETMFSSDSIVLVNGGETRQESVLSGLAQVREDYVLIHDGARPWLEMDCIDRIIETLALHKACLLMVPVKDTIKQVSNGKVEKTLVRSTLWQAQTPQAFATSLIKECYQKAKQQQISATDDAQVVELCSDVDVYVVEGSYANTKVTTIEDIQGK